MQVRHNIAHAARVYFTDLNKTLTPMNEIIDFARQCFIISMI